MTQVNKHKRNAEEPVWRITHEQNRMGDGMKEWLLKELGCWVSSDLIINQKEPGSVLSEEEVRRNMVNAMNLRATTGRQ